ncbi:MAG: hypothetical protein IPL73_14770 [Candidatus Obscuribacter sp.]|nr:hypothetical protein [Candidatus Obscuribacter sp.]
MAAQKLADAIAKTRQHLIKIQNQEAGWFPYKKDGDPSMEASAWSLMALDQVSAIQKGYNFICQAQNADGGWSTKPDAGARIGPVRLLCSVFAYSNRHYKRFPTKT